MFSKWLGDVLLFAFALTVMMLIVSGGFETKAKGATQHDECISHYNVFEIPFENGSSWPIDSRIQSSLSRQILKSGGILNIADIWMGIWSDNEFTPGTSKSSESQTLADDRKKYLRKLIPNDLSVVPIMFDSRPDTSQSLWNF